MTMLKNRAANRSRVRLGFESLEDRFAPAVFTVNTLADGPANHADAQLTLREAVDAVTAGGTGGLSLGEIAQIAGEFGVGDTIVFAEALTAAGPGSISLTAGKLELAASEVYIQGPGRGRLTIERSATAATSFRIFDVFQNVISSITDLTLARGAPALNDSGGAILNGGELTVRNVDFLDNVATGPNSGGGAIENLNVLNLSYCTFTGNSAFFGGAIDEQNGSAVAVIDNCTFNFNTAGSGGAIYLDGTVLLTNSTFSANSTPTNGGAIRNNGVLTLVNCTLTGNRADSDGTGDGAGGGIKTTIGQTTILYNSIVAGNLLGSGTGTASDLESLVNVSANSKNNLIGDAATAGGLANGSNGNIVGNAGVGTRPIASILDTVLANNGGLTRTHALVENSVALAAGIEGVPNYHRFDQRDAARDGGTPDIGAYEVQHPLAPVGVPSTNRRTFAPSPSPDAITSFVKGLYQSTLLRAPEASGLSFWVNAINTGMTRDQVASGFYNSFENRANQVAFFYRYFLDRDSEPSGLNYHVGRLQSGVDEGVVMSGFILSPEFAGQNDNTSFVNLMYYALLSRGAEPSGFAFWKNALDIGTMTRAQEVDGFLRSQESIRRVVGADFISYLKHPADAQSLSDFTTSILGGASFGSVAIALLGSEEFFAAAGANL